jgi:hypothetical protein
MKKLNKKQLANLEDKLYDNLSDACWEILKDDRLTEEFRYCVQDNLKTVSEHLGEQIKEKEIRKLIARRDIPFPTPPHSNEMDN